MEKKRVTFEDGSWWELSPVMTVGMIRAIASIQARVVNIDEVKEAFNEAQKSNKPLKQLKMLDAEGNDLTFEINYELTFAATLEWSYGEVTKEVYKDIPLDHYTKAVRRVDELYSQVPLAGKSTKS